LPDAAQQPLTVTSEDCAIAEQGFCDLHTTALPRPATAERR